jgi:hypothetical protein
VTSLNMWPRLPCEHNCLVPSFVAMQFMHSHPGKQAGCQRSFSCLLWGAVDCDSSSVSISNKLCHELYLHRAPSTPCIISSAILDVGRLKLSPGGTSASDPFSVVFSAVLLNCHRLRFGLLRTPSFEPCGKYAQQCVS